MTPQEQLLALHLEMAVPLEIAQIMADGGPNAQDLAQCYEEAQVIGEYADQVLYGGPQCRRCLAAMVHGLAVLAFQPGGVKLNHLGLHFEVMGQRLIGGTNASDTPAEPSASPTS